MRWLAVLLVVAAACSSVAPGPGTASPVAASSQATPSVPIAADPPEPTAPQIECKFTRNVSCHDGIATRTAWQPPPFERCAPTRPATQPDFPAPGNRAHFSAVETRAARARTPQACCYVDFIAGVCL